MGELKFCADASIQMHSIFKFLFRQPHSSRASPATVKPGSLHQRSFGRPFVLEFCRPPSFRQDSIAAYMEFFSDFCMSMHSIFKIIFRKPHQVSLQVQLCLGKSGLAIKEFSSRPFIVESLL